MNRRSFVTALTVTMAGGLFIPGLSLRSLTNRHREICEQTFSTAADINLERRPIGEVVIEVAKLFKGMPYEAHTLEAPGEEQLVINLEVFDCVTLVENSLALARCIKKQTTTFEAFTRELQTIRYRGGVIDGYPSRLHYFSDWIYDNVQKGIVADATGEIGEAEPFSKTINFMSNNPGSYRHLSDYINLRAIQKQEEIMISRDYRFVPKGNFHMYEHNLKDGDILAFTTNIRGLDIQHTGLAVTADRGTHVLHAPTVEKAVEITENNLMMYMTMNRRMTGLMIARPREV
jgi:hypothetical protein